MKIEVIEAIRTDRQLFSNMFQFYLYDFSEMIGLDVERSGTNAGRFDEDDLDGCWLTPYRFTYLLKVEDDYAGCAIVDDLRLHPQPQDLIDMAEFFVMRKYRRQGIGKVFAFTLFDKFHGHWRVGQLQENVNALAFWRKVIGEYTHNQYEDKIWQGKIRRGTEQYFDNRE